MGELSLSTEDQVLAFKEVIETYYFHEMLENSRKGDMFLVMDFNKINVGNPDLGEALLDEPEEVIAAAHRAVKDFDLPGKAGKFEIRIKGLPTSEFMLLRNIRSKHLRRFKWTKGVVRQKGDVRPQAAAYKFECPSCGNIMNILQLDKKRREPPRCPCGRKGFFKEISKELFDVQMLDLEEASDDLEGGEQPKRMKVLLKNDLVSPINEKKTSPGNQITVNGWVTEIPITLKTGGKSTRYDLIIDANFIKAVEEDFSEIKITPEEKKKIKKLAADSQVYSKLINSVAPSIYGHETIKEALILQLVGGVRKEHYDGIVTRGDMHVLLIGDPGCGKSQLLKRISKVAPKCRYVSGKGVSGAGLTASVVKDEFLGGWSLEAGALVLANKGFCCIDEMDKMGKEDRSALHEALEQQTVSISKANIQATLRCETTVLAAANPKFGRFDPYDIIGKQIDMPPTLINRFDLIFPVKDMPEPTKDEKLASHILRMHQDTNANKGEIDSNLMKKFIAYVRMNVKPVLSDEAFEKIKTYYVKMRNQSSEEGIRSVPITARQLEGLVRLSEASAKIRLSKTVNKNDAQRAIRLLEFCLNQVARDSETGQIDIDKIGSSISSSTRNKISIVKEMISKLESQVGKTIPVQDIIEMAKEKGLNENDVEEVVEKLRRVGDLFEPRKGFISRIS